MSGAWGVDNKFYCNALSLWSLNIKSFVLQSWKTGLQKPLSLKYRICDSLLILWKTLQHGLHLSNNNPTDSCGIHQNLSIGQTPTRHISIVLIRPTNILPLESNLNDQEPSYSTSNGYYSNYTMQPYCINSYNIPYQQSPTTTNFIFYERSF